MSAWEPETFEIASMSGPQKTSGYVYRGLGLAMLWTGSPKGRRPPMWALYHLGSGHVVVNILGSVATAFPVASEIAEAGDWDFLSLEGWKDRFPDAPEKVREIMAKHPGTVSRGGQQHRESAMAIASNRP